MALTKRIIPCLDIDQGRVVKGLKFVDIREAGDPVMHARRYSEQGADEIMFLDITASHEGRKTTLATVESVAEQLFVPLSVGGGLRSCQDARDLLNAGADKISVNTAAVSNPELISQLASRFGRQCVVVAIDARAKQNAHHEWEVCTHGGRRRTGMDAVAWAGRAAELGAGEILLTSMDKDGTGEGYDVPLLRAVNERVDIPVIASGGAGTLEHLVEGLHQGRADAILAASIFHFNKMTIAEVKQHLAEQKLPVRL